MTSDIIRILVPPELSILPVTCTQMIAYSVCVSRQWFICFFVVVFSSYLDDSLINGPSRVGSIYYKYVYKRYTDWLYDSELPSDPTQGYLGPLIHGEVGDVIRVHIRNLCQHEISIHPHGAQYTKKNEGTLYEPRHEKTNVMVSDQVQH